MKYFICITRIKSVFCKYEKCLNKNMSYICITPQQSLWCKCSALNTNKAFEKRNSDLKKKPTNLSFVSYTCRCNLRHYISSKKEHSSITCWVELNTILKWKLYKGILKKKSADLINNLKITIPTRRERWYVEDIRQDCHYGWLYVGFVFENVH